MFWVYLLAFNALFGLAAFEFAWAGISKLRTYPDYIDKRFPAVSRGDKNMSKLSFYPGAMTLFFFRMVIYFLTVLLFLIFASITLIGYKYDPKNPLRGTRRRIINMLARIGSWLLLAVSGIRTKVVK